MRKMTGIGLGVLLMFAVSEAGAATVGLLPAVPPAATESEEAVQVADRKSSKQRVGKSREERRQTVRDRANSRSTRSKIRRR